MGIDLQGRIAIVTGAGGGLGRAHALALAHQGAKVVVNDLGAARDGCGRSNDGALAVVEEIRAMGGDAVVNGANVTDYAEVEAMIEETVGRWGRLDILVNNAGILRDRTFAKMDLADFRSVLDVHLMGTVHCIKAAWEGMRAQRFGRIIVTTSSSGLYGNFGQANYGAAKMALVGLMNTLRLEGQRYGIHINALAPSAATRMTEDIMETDMMKRLDPALVAPAVVALASDDAPNGAIICAGAGNFARAYITLTNGHLVGPGPDAADRVLSNLDSVSDRDGEVVPSEGAEQSRREFEVARRHAAAAL